MDIPAYPANPLLSSPTQTLAGVSLQLNQRLTAQVIEVQTLLNSLTLKIGDQQINVTTPQASLLQAGQNLNLQVIKLVPQPVFQSIPDTSNTPKPTSTPLQVLLTVLPPTPRSAPQGLANLTQSLSQLPLQTAQVVELAPNKITLSWTPPATNPLPATVSAAIPIKIELSPEQWQSTAAPNLEQPAEHRLVSANPALTVGQTVQIQLKAGTANNPAKIVISPAILEGNALSPQIMRELLPIQASPSLLLEHLQLLPTAETVIPTLAETLKTMARSLLAQLPTPTQLSSPSKLKQSIQQSGLFLESKLAAFLADKSELDVGDDFKLKLNKLAHWLQNSLPASDQEALPTAIKQWLQAADQHNQSALAKLTLDQLNSLPKEDSNKQTWIVELPVQLPDRVDSIHIEIEQDKKGDQPQAQETWAVSITITPPDLATIQCRIACYENTINTRFWSESADTVATINENLDVLKQQFATQGLNSGFMEAHQDQKTKAPMIHSAGTGLIREKV